MDARVREEKAHAFLASHTYFFHGFVDFVYPYPVYYSKVRLGSEYVTDFAFFITTSFGPEWRFVEIEPPRKTLFTRSGDLSATLNHAVQQTRDWLRWCEDSLAGASKLMPGLRYPMCFVFLGRRAELTPTTTEKLRQLNYQWRAHCQVRTFDALAEHALSVKSLGSARWRVPAGILALSHADLAGGIPEDARSALTRYIPDELTGYRLKERDASHIPGVYGAERWP